MKEVVTITHHHLSKSLLSILDHSQSFIGVTSTWAPNIPTSEHAYQFRACEEHLRADLAEQVLKGQITTHGKNIASHVKDHDPTSNWNLIKYDVMREVLMAKITTNPDFKCYLYESGIMAG